LSLPAVAVAVDTPAVAAVQVDYLALFLNL
jgi:hypothetical protein